MAYDTGSLETERPKYCNMRTLLISATEYEGLNELRHRFMKEQNKEKMGLREVVAILIEREMGR